MQLPPADSLPELPPLELPGGEAGPGAPATAGPGTGNNPAPVAQPVVWHRSPREARKKAMELGRPMLLVFGGFGWSPACKALNQDLFAHPEFNQFASQNLVLSFLNVPTRASFSKLGSTKTELKQQQLHAIKAYRAFLKVRSLPTIIIFDGEGIEVDRMQGYNFNKDLRPFSLTKAVERIARVTKSINAKRMKQQARRKMLQETQNYQLWSSRAGKTLFAKLYGRTETPIFSEDEASKMEPAAIFMDETGVKRTVPLRLLTLADAEVVRRLFQKSAEEWRNMDPSAPYRGLPVRTPDSGSARVNVGTPVADKP